jgi:hypothetical protein
MNVSRILIAATASLSALATMGCSSPQTNQYAAATPAPVFVPAAPQPEPVMVAEAMPAPPQATTVVVVRDDPIVMAANTPSYVAPTVITERAPQADRN